MNGHELMSGEVCRLSDPSVQRRERIIRRIVLLVFIAALANFVATKTGCALPSAHELWERLVFLGQAVANIAA